MPADPARPRQTLAVERSVLLWKLPAGQMPIKTGSIANLSIDFHSDPDLQELLGPDQQVVSRDYARMSTVGPDLTAQRDGLAAHGVDAERIYVDCGLLQLVASGLAPYPALPGWPRAYFTALTVLNPLAAVLLARRLRSGVVLTAAVLVSDAAVNGWANHTLDDTTGITTGRVGHAAITTLAVALLIALPCFWHATSSGRLSH